MTALNRAYWKRKPAKGLIVHSDRGVQYASKEFRKALNLFWYIEIYYNRVRKHSANGWKTPDHMEQIYFCGKPECMV
jgi:transposase InsO family protein